MVLFLVPYVDGQDKKANKLAQKYAKKGANAYSKADYEKSIASYTCAINENPKEASYRYMHGIINSHLGNDSVAISDFTKTIELSPYHENAYFERGLVQHSLGNYLAAFNDFYEHTKYNLEEERTLVAKVNSLLAIEDYSKAFPYYEQLVPLVPDVTLHQINLALCYIETGNLKDGKSTLDAVILKDDESYERYHAEGLYYLKNKEPHKSIEAFQHILFESKPGIYKSDSYRYSSNAFHAVGQLDSALIHITWATQLNPKAEYYLDRANYYVDAEILSEAVKDYDKAIELDSTLTGAYNNRTFFIWFPRKEYQKAVEDMTAIIQFDTNNAYAYSNRSYAYYGLKDFEHAFIDAFKSVELENRNPYVYKNLALRYYTIGEKEEASNAAKGALNWGFPVDSDPEFQELLVNLGFSN